MGDNRGSVPARVPVCKRSLFPHGRLLWGAGYTGRSACKLPDPYACDRPLIKISALSLLPQTDCGASGSQAAFPMSAHRAGAGTGLHILEDEVHARAPTSAPFCGVPLPPGGGRGPQKRHTPKWAPPSLQGALCLDSCLLAHFSQAGKG